MIRDQRRHRLDYIQTIRSIHSPSHSNRVYSHANTQRCYLLHCNSLDKLRKLVQHPAETALTAPLWHSYILLVHSQESQAPELYDVALGRGECTQGHGLVPVVVPPAPDLAAQLRAVLIDRIPKRVVGILNFRAKILAAEICGCISDVEGGRRTARIRLLGESQVSQQRAS
jgi:hypothetical protein